MIDDKRKIIFIHIRKTAGQYIEQCLGWDLEWIHLQSKRNNDKRSVLKHGVPSHKVYKKRWNKEYYKFTFVRNPYDRFVSYFFYNLTMPNNSRLRNFIRKRQIKTPERFFYACLKHKGRQKNKKMRYTPAAHYLKNYKYDFIGKVESLDKDLSKVFEDLTNRGVDVGKYQPQPKTNTTDHEHYSQYFQSPKFQKDFYAHFKRDFEISGYSDSLEEKC